MAIPIPKDVWKRAILRTDVLSHQISSPLAPKSPQNCIFGDLLVQTYYRERELSVSRTLMELKLYSYIDIGKYFRVYQNFSARGRPGAQGLLM